jgi:hypothetical protein
MPSTESNMQLLELARDIADRTARCDIELFAKDTWIDGVQHYDTTVARCFDVDVVVVREAVNYLDLRGDVFPWRMERHQACAELVRFVDKSTDTNQVEG